jgi:hypothetical protein
VFFAFYGLANGYLIFKSTFLPRFIGVLLAIAGLAWMIFLSPPLGEKLFPYLLASDLGELLLILWLVVFGVNAERWKEVASAAG